MTGDQQDVPEMQTDVASHQIEAFRQMGHLGEEEGGERQRGGWAPASTPASSRRVASRRK